MISPSFPSASCPSPWWIEALCGRYAGLLPRPGCGLGHQRHHGSPYYQFNGDGPEATPTDATGKRSIGFAYISSAITKDDTVEIDVRGKRPKAKLTTRHIRQDLPPYVRPVL